MTVIKLNNNKKVTRAFGSRLALLLTIIGASYSQLSYGQDLAANTELKDSPLSLSLTTSVSMSVGNQTQQLIVSQYGIFNKATVSQMANAGNSIAVYQDGVNNLATLVQTGYGNTINLQQQGNGNLAEVIQDGDANLANIRQEGEQSFIVHQIGNDMVVNISQY